MASTGSKALQHTKTLSRGAAIAHSIDAMQAQCVLFWRYPEVLQPFKYAGYPMLLQAITLPSSDEQAEGQGPADGGHQRGDVSTAESAHFLDPSKMPQLQVGCACGGMPACPLPQGMLRLMPDTSPCCIMMCGLDAQCMPCWVKKNELPGRRKHYSPYGLCTLVERCV